MVLYILPASDKVCSDQDMLVDDHISVPHRDKYLYDQHYTLPLHQLLFVHIVLTSSEESITHVMNFWKWSCTYSEKGGGG